LVEVCQRLGRWEQDLVQFRPNFSGPSFYHCWFLSLGHLNVLLDHVTDIDSFVRELRRLKAMTLGMMDFYSEYRQVRAWASTPQKS